MRLRHPSGPRGERSIGTETLSGHWPILLICSPRAPGKDRWSNEVSTSLLLSRKTTPYRTCNVYKGVSERQVPDEAGIIEYRVVHYPAPNEMLVGSSAPGAMFQLGWPLSPKSRGLLEVMCFQRVNLVEWIIQPTSGGGGVGKKSETL